MRMTRHTRDQLASDVTSLEAALADASARLRDAEERAAALAEEKAELDGKANLARRAVADFEERIAERQRALEAAEKYHAACEALDAAVGRRDAVGRQFATAALALVTLLDQLTHARTEVAALQDDLRRRFSASGADIPGDTAEPTELTDAWNALRERLQLERNLDEELLEAAARSPYAVAVDKLPPHLQEAGRRRWLERRRDPQQR
jgi:chromosome segregation ATPase